MFTYAVSTLYGTQRLYGKYVLVNVVQESTASVLQAPYKTYKRIL